MTFPKLNQKRYLDTNFARFVDFLVKNQSDGTEHRVADPQFDRLAVQFGLFAV